MNLTWQLAALFRLAANAAGTYWGRKIANRDTFSVSLALLYFTAAAFSVCTAVLFGQFEISRTTLIIGCIGIGNGAAMYFLLMANSKSTAQNGFFTAFDDIGAMVLTAIYIPTTVIVIHERNILGMALCLGAAFGLAYNNYRKKRKQETGAIPMIFYLYAVLYTVLWGIAIFVLGFFAVKDIGVWRFSAAWYTGSALTSLLILAIDGIGLLPHPEKPERASTRTIILEAVGLGLSTSLALVCQYTAFRAVSLIILQPLFLVSDLLVAITIGVVFWGEGRKLDWRDYLYLIVGTAGFLVIFLFA